MLNDHLNQETEQDTDLTRHAYEDYIRMIKPYEHKVYVREQLLDTRDTEQLEAIRRGILQYHGLMQQGIYGMVANILGLDAARRTAETEKQLSGERKRLRKQIRSGTLGQHEKEGIYARLNEIRSILEPEHYRG